VTSINEDVYVFPTTYPQKQIWFINQLNKESPAYNIPFAYDVDGELDIPAIQKTINEIIRRHETFRTIFMDSNDGPIQVVQPDLVIDIPVLDYSQSSEADAEIKQYIDDESVRIFDLSKGPLVRASIIIRAEFSYILVLNFHHIILDHISIVQFSEELNIIYTAFVKGDSSPLVKPELQYADYSVWQKENQTHEKLLPKLDFWTEQFKGKSEYLDIPLDYQRPARQSMVGREYHLRFPLSLSKSLKVLSRQESVSVFITLMAGYSVLLGLYSKQSEISVGTPFANRSLQPELEKIMGCFINTIPIHTDLSGNPSFSEVLKRVRKMVFGANANQELPFEMIVEALQPKRDASYNPMFQVGFTFQEPPMEIQIEGCSVKSQRLHNQSAKFDIFAWLWDSEDGIRGLLEYNTDLFDYATLERFSEHFKTLLENVVINPDVRISELNILSDAEYQKVIKDWNQTSKEYNQPISINGLFEAQCEEHANKTAVICNNVSLTYKELNDKSNQLANFLISQGVRNNALIGVCLERSVDMLVTTMGVLKAGACYIPLDPEYPQDRIQFMLENSDARFVVTECSVSNKIDFSPSVKLIQVDADSDRIKSQDNTAPVVNINKDDLAYIIYTSGSTGKPKGVMVPHSAAANFLLSMAEKPGICSNDTLLAVTTLSFDIAVLEMYLPLSQGATVVIANAYQAMDGNDLIGLISEYDISIMQATPATWRLLLASNWDGNRSLKVLCGGEAMPRDLLVDLLPRVSQLWNMYGPTETTVWSSCYQIKDVQAPILIGKPIANTQFYVLDEYLRPVPVGIHGELYIGGSGVTQGYLNRDDLTAERYIENPFSSGDDHLYRTGDVVKFHQSGDLEYYQRVDNQVKVRGFRIELGEIESVIAKQNEVEQVAVIVQELTVGDPILTAYVVLDENSGLEVSSIRNLIRDDLPGYMIPQHVIELDELPLTPNGKIDRKALVDLRAPSTQSNDVRSGISTNYVAPETELEKNIALEWMSVLSVQDVGVNDNFFELGGHSLLLAKIVSRLKKNLSVSLPIGTMFEYPTISEWVKFIQQKDSIQEDAVPLVLPTNKKDYYVESLAEFNKVCVYPATYPQKQIWFINQVNPESPAYNIPHAYDIEGDLNIPVLQKSINEIIRRHETFRTNFIDSDYGPVQVVRSELELDIPITDLSQSNTVDSDIRKMLDDESVYKFDLSKGPLIKARIFKCAESSYVLALIFHHIILDQTSIGHFSEELSLIYKASLEGGALPLAQPELQYSDYSVWQDEHQSYDMLKSRLDFWTSLLQDKSEYLDLPLDHQRPVMQSMQGKHYKLHLPLSLTEKLRALARHENVSIYITLMTAYSVLLGIYSKQTDISVGTPFANRSHQPELETIMGCFINTIPIYIDLSGNPEFGEALDRVRKMVLGASANQELPFEMIVEALHPKRDTSFNPLFQVGFTFQEPPMEVSLDGCIIESRSLYNHSAKFDLFAYLWDSKDGIRGNLEYNSELFDMSTMESFAEHYQILLEDVVNNPDAPISDLNILSDAEHAKVTRDWNQTFKEFESAKTIHQLFESQCENNANKVAVICDDEELTYQQLNEKANQLAHYLISQGVKDNALVGVCLERSLDMLVATLGILKSGACYIPLDPEYPQDRIQYMLENSQATLVVTQSSVLKRTQLPEISRPIQVDEDSESISSQAVSNPDIKISPDDLAYIIYTSGSTGKPKGVMVHHGAAGNFILSMAQTPGLSSEDTLLAVTTLSFDIAVLELYLPLSQGATVVIATTDEAIDGDDLIDLMDEHDVSVMQATPATWRLLLACQWKGDASLKVLCGGEAMPRDLLVELLPRVKEVWNMYGPTETTVWSSCFKITDANAPILIGKPISNTQFYVLDEHLRPVPVGVPGELYIGGDGVTKGYLNREDLTEERYILSPFGSAGERLYRTGDAVKYHESGDLEYSQRIDNQVKVRGFRIELGEIETVLAQQEGIEQAVVIVNEARAGDPRLVAYIVVSEGVTMTPTSIRDLIKHDLPDYMLPQHFVELDELPLTPNGKVDRKALPDAFADHGADNEEKVLPQTFAGKELAKIWADVLDTAVENIGAHDNFFDLGGHSLLSMQVIMKVKDITGVKINPRVIILDSLEHMAEQCDFKEEETATADTQQAETKKKSMINSMFKKIFN